MSIRRAALTESIVLSMRHMIASGVLTNERIARSVGLNVVDMQTLHVLTLRGGSLSAGQLGELTGLPSSSTTRVVDRLAEAGYVRRVADPGDRRKVLVVEVPEQVEGLSSHYEEMTRSMDRLHAGFTAAELAVVARYLDIVATGDWAAN